MRSVSKIMRCQKNRYDLNFQNVGFKMNQRLVIVYDPTLIHGSDVLKIVAVSFFLTSVLQLFFFTLVLQLLFFLKYGKLRPSLTL